MTVAAVALVTLAAACGGSDSRSDGTRVPDAGGGVAAATTATAPSDVGTFGDAVEVAAGAPAAAGGVACDVTRRMLETASEVYLTINAAPPPDQLALVDSGMIEELSAWFEVTADGAVVPAPGRPCS